MQETARIDPKEAKVVKYKCQGDNLFFTRYFFKKRFNRKFVIGDHHRIICDALERVVTGKCKRLIINIAPRYGKTELAVINFIAYGFSINPAAKFIHLSYSDDLALDNSEQAKNLVTSEAYQEIFPEVQIAPKSKAKDRWQTTAGGGVLARASRGQVTGFGAGQVDNPELENKIIDDMDEYLPTFGKEGFGGAIIIDDPIKPEDADSDTVRESINSRFDSTIKNRVNSRDTPIILIMQRLHPEDLAGYLQRSEETENWEVIELPCITYDETGKAKALWPFKHTVEELLAMKKANEVVYERQYNQNPKPKAGLMFPQDELNWYSDSEPAPFGHFDNIDEMLSDPDHTYVCADPANLGGDDFAGLVTKLCGNRIYLPRVLYNTDGADANEVELPKIIIEEKAHAVGVEGVFGWKETAERIRATLQKNPKFEADFRILRPRTNKHVRINSRSSFIKNHLWFNRDLAIMDKQYAKFIKNLTSYLKIQAPGSVNKHDEAPDVCEMAGTYFERNFPEVAWNVISKMQK